jgi:hypothetical protein
MTSKTRPQVRLTASPIDGRLEVVAISGDGSAALGIDSYPREELDEAIERANLLAIVFDADFYDARI